jgi:DNA-directed RNA polymerase subunit M
MFCPKCKRLMRPDRSQGRWVCRSCGHTVKMTGQGVVAAETPKARSLSILEGKTPTLPTTKEECPKCGNAEAYWVLRQTRGADEPETRIFECTQCGHKWREYQ